MTYTCENFKYYFKSAEDASGDFKGKISLYVSKTSDEYWRQSGIKYTDYLGIEHPGDKVRELENELRIQKNEFLIDLIRSYHKALSKARGSYEEPTCIVCP